MLRQVKKLFFCLHIILSNRYQVSYNISLDLRPEVSYYSFWDTTCFYSVRFFKTSMNGSVSVECGWMYPRHFLRRTISLKRLLIKAQWPTVTKSDALVSIQLSRPCLDLDQHPTNMEHTLYNGYTADKISRNNTPWNDKTLLADIWNLGVDLETPENRRSLTRSRKT